MEAVFCRDSFHDRPNAQLWTLRAHSAVDRNGQDYSTCHHHQYHPSNNSNITSTLPATKQILIANFKHFQLALWGLLPYTTATWPQDTTPSSFPCLCLPSTSSLPMSLLPRNTHSDRRAIFRNAPEERARSSSNRRRRGSVCRRFSHTHPFTCLHTPFYQTRFSNHSRLPSKRRNLSPSSTDRPTHSNSKFSCLNKRILYQPPTVVNFLTTRAPLFSFPPSCTLANLPHRKSLPPFSCFLFSFFLFFFLPQMIPLNTSSDLSSLKPLGNGMGWNILLLFTRTLIS